VREREVQCRRKQDKDAQCPESGAARDNMTRGN
jgi:hypothetical protein